MGQSGSKPEAGQSDNAIVNVPEDHISSSTQNECLLSICFERTLFCEDITYELSVNCAAHGISPWTMRLTVDELSKFYTETLPRCDGCDDMVIPNQYGKIMRTDTFTECLQKVLEVPGLLNSEDPLIRNETANLLSIPYGVRHLIQYDADQYDYVGKGGTAMRLIDGAVDKYKYMASRTMTFTPTESHWSGLNGVCCDRCDHCDAAHISSTSYWIRLLAQKVDLLLVSSCNNAFYVMMSDFARNIADALMVSVPHLDADCAWMIADYLPKQVFLDQSDPQCNAQIVYKYPVHEHDDRESTNFVLLSRHDFNALFVEQLHSLCIQMRRMHCTMTF